MNPIKIKSTLKLKGGNLPAYLALLAGIICIGFSAIFVRFAGISGPVSAFYRTLVAAVVVIPWWLLRKTVMPARKDILWIMAGGFFFAMDLVLWNTSLFFTQAATATLLANNAPIWVGLASLVLFRERLTKNYWLGLAVAIIGMTFLAGWDAWRQLKFNSGDLLALGASVFYAGYLLTTRKVRTRIDTLTFMALSVLATVFVLFLMNVFMGTTLSGFSTKTWASLIGMGLISHLGGWLAISYALGHLRAAPVSVSLLSQSVVTALLAIPLLGEALSLNQIIGGILVLSGIYFVNKKK